MDSAVSTELILELTISDPEVIAELEQFSPGLGREEFALKALKIGVLALQQARGRLDADVIRREGETLMSDLKNRLDNHNELLRKQMEHVLKEYFDPQSGRFQERVQLLVSEDGELERALKKQIDGKDSALSLTLLSHFGEESKLMKLLSPEQSQGILSLMKETLDEKLHSQRQHVLSQFSLDDDNSALSRLVRELKENHGQLSEDLEGKIDGLMKEFSFNEEGSALSRLVKNVNEAQQTITKEFSLDNEESSLVRLQKTLTETLKNQQDANQKFQEEVKEALAAMKARKEEERRSTRHGLTFEETLFEVIQREAQRQGDIAQHTGNTTGVIRHNKKGDVVVELSPESIARGEKIVIEAKQDKSYDLNKAREEIAEARNNRHAQIGLFVFSRETAPAGLEPVTRYGEDVFVIWDAEDAHSDLFLKVGYTLAKALCVKTADLTQSQQSDFNELDKAIKEIINQTDGLTDVESSATSIAKSSEKILKKIATVRKKIMAQTETLEENLQALKQSLEA
ncbi:MAG TPA: hypothetical protein VLA12_20885 [Planctomycetaceae bacterium]|nr:hypothetical protein [Planctomycetaceae bacterium]